MLAPLVVSHRSMMLAPVMIEGGHKGRPYGVLGLWGGEVDTTGRELRSPALDEVDRDIAN
jgi:hypothetical protein